MNNKTSDKQLVSISKAAEILGVSIDTIRRWDKTGIIKSERPNGKDRYFSVEELEKHKFQKPLSISEASEKLGISTSTLRRLEKKGLIKPERNANGERLYDKDALEKFLNSEYFLREKEVQEKILEPLTPPSQEVIEPKKEVDEKQDQTIHVVNLTLKSIEDKVKSLLGFQKAFYGSGLFLATTFVLLIFLITALFLLFPHDTASFFGYKKSTAKELASGSQILGDKANGKQRTIEGNVVGKVLKPLSNISLGIVKEVNPAIYEQIALSKVIEDINEVLTYDKEGNITTYFTFKPQDSSYLQIPDEGLIKNLNAELLQGKKPGTEVGDLSIVGEEGGLVITDDLADAAITTLKIADGSITSAKLASGLSTALTDDSVLTKHIKDGEIKSADIRDNTITTNDLENTLSFGDNDFIDLSSVIHDDNALQGLRLPNTGSSPTNPASGEGYLAWDATGNQLVVYNGTGWGPLVGGAQNLFQTIAVSGQSNVVTDNTTDILTLAAGSNITITTDASSDTVTIASTGGGANVTVEEGDVLIDATVNDFDFLASDFAVSESPEDEVNISIDYTNSKIVRSDQSETITGGWTFTGSITANDASADTILIGQSGATDDTVTIAGDISLTDDQWSISAAGVGSFVTGTVIGSQTFTTNNIADSGPLTISSANLAANFLIIKSGDNAIGISGEVELKSGTGTTATGSVSILSGNASTGTAGNIVLDVGTSAGPNGSILIGTAARAQTINIGTNASGGEIFIGSNINTGLTLQDAQWSITDAGAASFASVTEGGTALSAKYAPIAANFVTVTANGTLTGETGIDALTTAISTTSTLNADGATTLAGLTLDAGSNFTMTSGTGLFTQNHTVTTDATADAMTLTLSAGGTGETGTLRGLVISQADTATTGVYDSLASIINLKTPETTTNGLLIQQNAASGTLTNAIQIAETAGTITDGILITGTLGNILNTASIDISGAGAITGATGVSSTTGTFSSAIAANGGITFDAGTDTVGAFTAAGTIAMGANALTGTTGIIDYTGFDVDASGNLDALGTITAGSGNTAVTDATGNVLHDALVDCTDTQILKWATGGGRWGCAADASGGSTAFDAIGDPAGAGAVAMAETAQTLDWNTAATAAAFNGLTVTITNDATTDTLVQRAFVVANLNDSLTTGALETMVQIDNRDIDEIVTNGLLIEQTGAGTMTNAIQIAETAGAITNGLRFGTGIGSDILFATDATHTLQVENQDTDATAGSDLQITGAAGNTWGGGGGLLLTAGQGGASGAGGVITLTSGAGGGSLGNSGALTLLTGNTTLGTAGNISVDVGTSSSGNGSILIGTAARSQTISIGTNATGGVITIGSSTNTGLVLSDAQWSVTDAGAASFASVSAPTYTGAGAVTYDAGGAAAITIGSADVTSITLTTDGTGTAEVVLPGGAIGAAELDSAFLDAVGDVASGLCTGSQVLKKNVGNTAWECAADASGGSTAWDAIADPAGAGAIAFGETVQTLDYTITTANASLFSFNFTNNGGTAGTDSGVVINNALSANATGDLNTENLLLIQQLDTTTGGTTVVDNALKIDSAASSAITDGIEITNSAGSVTNGINIVDTAGGTITTGILMSGTFANLIDTPNFDVSNAGAVVAVGVNSGTGLLQGTGGLTITGAAISLNASSNFAVNIATGTSTGAVTIGGNLNTVAIDSSDWDISTAGVITGVGAITSDGAISTTSTLNADGATTLAALTLDANSDLTLTSGTGSVIVTNSVSNASDQVIDINPAFAGGATDLLTYTVIDVAAFTPTNAAGLDTVEGLAIRALTQGADASRLTANAITIGDGWDLGITGATYTIEGTAALTIGGGGGTIALNSSDWDISTTGVLTGIGAITADGLITGSGGLTLTGATAIAIGNNLSTVAIDSSDWDISTTGVITGVGGITMDGNFSQTGATTLSTGTGGITLNGAVTANTDVDLTLLETENLGITNTVSGTNAVDLVAVTLTDTTTSGTQRGMVLTKAANVTDGTTEALLVLDNAETTANILTDYLLITKATTGPDTTTDAIDVSDPDLGVALRVDANSIIGTTGIIDYTGFDVDVSGNLDALGTITAGSGNTAVTDATGNVLHDALVDCTDTQILKWATGGGRWGCATDATSAGGGTSTVKENDVAVDVTVTTLDFLGADFDLTESPEDEINVVINAGISRDNDNESITGDWGFSFAAAEALDITSDIATAGTLNIASITGTPSATNGTIRGLAIINALSANANGIDTGILIDNADDAVAIGTGISITSSGGGAITTGIDLTATAIGTGISMGANDIVGTTGIINYTGFDVDASGNLDALGTITAGSSNIAVTDSTGHVQHDSIVDCTDGQILKWATGGGEWGCASDATGSGPTTKYLTANHAISSTTATEVTSISTTLAAGTYVFTYYLIVQSATATVSPMYGVNFTGTATTRKMTLRYPGTGTTAITGVADDAGATAGQINEQVTVTNYTTTAPNMGHTGGVGTINTNVFVQIDGIIVVTVSGDLELWHSSETATSTTIMANSSLVITPISAGADLAEIYGTMDTSMRAGDVVSLDPNMNAGVRKSTKAYDRNAFGIVSTSPSLVMGSVEDEEAIPVMVALSGRVPVKVTTENGPIKFGDLLTSSSTPGVAMRATKAGQIIGQAMSEFNGQGVGSVLAFVKTDYSNGAKIADILPGLSIGEEQVDSINMSKLVLEKFITQQHASTSSAQDSVDLSEIVTDRVAVGLEVITPKVTAQELSIDTISASTGSDIALNLTSDGKFIIKDEEGNTAISFDSQGNAFFKGIVSADKIKANQIEGLEIFTNQISYLGDLVNEFASESAILSASDSANLENSPAATNTLTLASLSVDGLATISADLRVKGNGLIEGIVTVIDTLTTKNILVTGVSDFFDKVVFRGDVEFRGRPAFSKDTAGIAVVKKDSNKVDVVFEKEYEQTPFVNISITLDDGEEVSLNNLEQLILAGDIRYIVTKRTTKGFSIKLNKNTPEDLKFSWTAISVRDAKTSKSVAPVSVATPVSEEAGSSAEATISAVLE